MKNNKPVKMGRPEVEIDMEQLAVFCRMKPTLADCAAFFKCHEDTIENRIRESTGLTFSLFREQNLTHTRFNLIRRAIQMADSGNVPMLIFSLKNLCGWRDKQPEEEPRPAGNDPFREHLDNLLESLGTEKGDENGAA